MLVSISSPFSWHKKKLPVAIPADAAVLSHLAEWRDSEVTLWGSHSIRHDTTRHDKTDV